MGSGGAPLHEVLNEGENVYLGDLKVWASPKGTCQNAGSHPRPAPETLGVRFSNPCFTSLLGDQMPKKFENHWSVPAVLNQE